MKKFLSTLLVGLFAIPVIGCDANKQGTNWAKYLKVQDGDVTLVNGQEIEMVNEAEEELPEGYEIVALTDTTTDQSGTFQVTYGIVDANGKVVYKHTVTYNVTVQYQGLSLEGIYKAYEQDGTLSKSYDLGGYLWNVGNDGYLSIDSSATEYQSFKFNFQEFVEMIKSLFPSEETEEEIVEDIPQLAALRDEVAEASTLEQIIALIYEFIQTVTTTVQSIADMLFVIEDDVENKTRTYTVQTMAVGLLVGVLLDQLVKAGLLDEETAYSYLAIAYSFEGKLTLIGFDVEGEELVGTPSGGGISAKITIEEVRYELDCALISTTNEQPETPSGEYYISYSLAGAATLGLYSGEESIKRYNYIAGLDVLSYYESSRLSGYTGYTFFLSNPLDLGEICEFTLNTNGSIAELEGYFLDYNFSFSLTELGSHLFIEKLKEESKTKEESELDPYVDYDFYLLGTFVNPVSETDEGEFFVEAVIGGQCSLYAEYEDKVYYAKVENYDRTNVAAVRYDTVNKAFSALAGFGRFEIPGEGETTEELYEKNYLLSVAYVDELPQAVINSRESAVDINALINSLFPVTAEN